MDFAEESQNGNSASLAVTISANTCWPFALANATKSMPSGVPSFAASKQVGICEELEFESEQKKSPDLSARALV